VMINKTNMKQKSVRKEIATLRTRIDSGEVNPYMGVLC
jgi:hypothetical protein